MKKALRLLAFALCLALFCYAAFQLYTIYRGYRGARRYYEAAAAAYVKSAGPAESAAAPAEPAAAAAESAAESAAEPAETPPVSVDFDALRAEYPDAAAWLYAADTPLNYPVARAADNDYYLHRMLSGAYHGGGTIFLDAGNARDFTDDNTFFYGHNMKDGSMFHFLVNYRTQSYFDAHPVLWLLTPAGNCRVDLFAGFVTEADSWVYTRAFASAADKAAYLEKAAASSTFKSAVAPSPADRLVTLSTCSYETSDARCVLLGVLTPVP